MPVSASESRQGDDANDHGEGQVVVQHIRNQKTPIMLKGQAKTITATRNQLRELT